MWHGAESRNIDTVNSFLITVIVPHQRIGGSIDGYGKGGVSTVEIYRQLEVAVNELLDEHWVQITVSAYKAAGLSYGQSLMNLFMDAYMGDLFTHYDNVRLPEMRGLELDRLYEIPTKRGHRLVAFEFQGDQHFMDTAKFGSAHDLMVRDVKKNELCKRNKILLFRVTTKDIAPNQRGLYKVLAHHVVPSKFLPVCRKRVKPIEPILLQLHADYRKTLLDSFGSQTANTSHTRMYQALKDWRRENITPRKERR